MKLNYSVPAFLVTVFISLTVLPKPFFHRPTFIAARPSRLFKAEIREGQETCG
jgi:hypothetical protein